MKSPRAARIAGALLFIFGGLTLFAGPAAAAQTTTPTFPVPKQNVPPPPPGKGKVIFSRSTDQNGQTTTQGNPAAAPTGPVTAKDAEREAVTFTGFDMDVRLRLSDHHIAVRALITIRNDGKSPLSQIPLQISSSLQWERIRVQDRDATIQASLLNSDADHTGKLWEAAVPLAAPLAPGASLALDVTYSGPIEINAQRLLALGTPEDVALHSDWDEIGAGFTGLRGFGNVVWYPASSVPVLLGDGARLFDEMGAHKLRLSGAHFRMRLTVEFPAGQPPTIALVNGHPAALNVASQGSLTTDVAGVAVAQSDQSILGFEAPSLFVAARRSHAGPDLTTPDLNLWTTPEDESNAQLWLDAATRVTPFLQGWLGQRPRAELSVLDLPDPQDAPFETGALLVTTIRDASPDQLGDVMAHALTHAWMQSPRAWLSEGVAHFMGTLWIEKQSGREKAISALEAGRPALTLIEPASPGVSPGQPLAQASSPAYYRTKAGYVLWMLRDLVGDPTLSAALRAYDPKQDLGIPTIPSLFERLLEQAGARHDLGWFFADWIDADKGLPDLAIQNVHSNPASGGNWLVAVEVVNSGYAAAEVPVTVRTDGATVTQRLRILGRGKAMQRILIQNKPTEVQVNDGTVPEVEASLHVTRIDQNIPPNQPSDSHSNPPSAP
ncbi:MAG TPA: hypothetical protein VKB38_10335 [Terracidiphilus sp.]|nr:hypothetical protein [Terracidiphilus sp.]